MIYKERCIAVKLGTGFDERHAMALITVTANSTHCASREK